MVRTELSVDCAKCFGLCCVALHFSTIDGFPLDKPAGDPCLHLAKDFRCQVHDSLKEKGLKGCIAFDCMGAGQKICSKTFEGRDWRSLPQQKNEMFEGFLIMIQLHQMLWYLNEAAELRTAEHLAEEIAAMGAETQVLTQVTSEALLKLDISGHRARVDALLIKASIGRRQQARAGRQIVSGKTLKKLKNDKLLLGADLRNTDLVGADLRGSLLIAANMSGTDLTGTDFIGADLRDADLSGANLSNSFFLTQGQINLAKGSLDTKLPKGLKRPPHWA